MSSVGRLVARSKRSVSRAMRGDLDRRRLEAAGVKVGGPLVVERGAWVDLEWGWLIEIGDRVSLGPRVMVFAHDASTRHALGYTRIAPVKIGSGVFIGAGSIVLPGVTIGSNSILGAGSVVSRDVPEASLAAGVPARVLGPVDDYLSRHALAIEGGLVLGDVFAEMGEPDWARRRSVLADAVHARGQAWVK